MSIYLKRGYWHFDFRVGSQRYTGSTHETERGRALSYEAIQRTEALERRLPPALRKPPKLCDYAQQFMLEVDEQTKAGHYTANGQAHYKRGVKLLTGTAVWPMRMDQIKEADIARLVFPGNASGNNALRVLRRMLNLAKKARLIHEVPAMKLFEDRQRTAIAEPWLEELMLEHSRDPLRSAIIFQLDAFLRPADVMAMRWENVLWAKNLIYIPKGKTKSTRRYVGLTSRMLSALQSRRPANATSGWVFPSVRSRSKRGAACGHTLPSSLDKMFRKMKARVLKAVHETDPGWEWPDDLVLYSMKHTGLTAYSSEVGSNQLKVAAAAGHTDLRTTQRYTHHFGDASSTMDALHERRQLRIVERKKA